MINRLGQDTIQKIAAGEVVERPASIIKELVENSIDAHASQINVEINNGGKSYIQVSDNGSGIEKDDVELAFERHATSKIIDFDDLYNIYSMGFRGEALASISSVANVIMKTKHDQDSLGSQIEYENGQMQEIKPIAMNRGTSIIVKDLFRYIPVRQKFLASDMTESNKITHLMYVFAIGNPQISFDYTKDNRLVFKTNSSNTTSINYETMFGKEFVDNSIEFENVSDKYQIEGITSSNKYYKGNRSMQFIYVNGRYIEDTLIVEAVEKAYSSLIPAGRFPVYKLNIKVDPQLIDVNIHPSKQVIKFSFSDELMNLITNTFRAALFENERSRNLKVDEDRPKHLNFYDLNEGEGYKKVLDAYKPPIEFKHEDRSQYQEDGDTSIESISLDEKYYDEKELKDFNIEYNLPESTNDENLNQQIKFEIHSLEFRSIVFNKYLIYENIENEKLVIVNIARANERLLYDRLQGDLLVARQELIDPIVVELNKMEIDLYEENKQYFEDQGFDIDYLDNTSIRIRQIPYYYEDPASLDRFNELLNDLSRINKVADKNDLILRKSLALSSRKSRYLNEDQAIAFIEELNKSSNPHTSQHGKTIISEIDKENFIKFIEK